MSNDPTPKSSYAQFVHNDRSNVHIAKVALVTGASTGIGAELAKDLVRSNYYVVLNGRDEQKLATVLAECLSICPNSAQLFVADLTDFKQLDNLIQFVKCNHTKLDLLVNNACWRGNSLGITSKEAYDDFRLVMHINLIVPMYLIHKCLIHLKSDTQIYINISSIASQVAVPIHSYSTSKACLSELTRQMSKTCEKNKIIAITISPGPVLTVERPQHVKMSHLTLLNRVGNPEEVSNFTIYAIENAHLFNGKELFVDGGYLARQKVVDK